MNSSPEMCTLDVDLRDLLAKTVHRERIVSMLGAACDAQLVRGTDGLSVALSDDVSGGFYGLFSLRELGDAMVTSLDFTDNALDDVGAEAACRAAAEQLHDMAERLTQAADKIAGEPDADFAAEPVSRAPEVEHAIALELAG